ncbi:MAG: hypothetical protein P0S96_04640 [Simkaniaceae bacterium]|nr:hypothetical protein [Candidatus Sacchlamyda saccharinae]
MTRLTPLNENGETEFRALGMRFVLQDPNIHEIAAVITRPNGDQFNVQQSVRVRVGKAILLRGFPGEFLEVIAIRIANGQRVPVASVQMPWSNVRYGEVVRLNPPEL